MANSNIKIEFLTKHSIAELEKISATIQEKINAEIKRIFEITEDMNRTQQMSRYILTEHASFKGKNIASLNWLPSSSEMTEIIKLMKENEMRFVDESTNQIHNI